MGEVSPGVKPSHQGGGSEFKVILCYKARAKMSEDRVEQASYICSQPEAVWKLGWG